jgi:MFS family permease
MTQTQPIRKSWLVQRSPIFYGWVVWGVAALGMSATSPGQSFSISLFIDHYIADFGLSRTTVSGLYGLGTFLAALGLTSMGRQIDRRGNRLASTVIAVLFAASLLACSLVMGPLTVLISFVAIRGLGQGALGLSSSTVIAEWFHARRGFVMGITLVCFALFQRMYLPWLQNYIDAHGWRQTWLVLGAGVGLIVAPLTWLLMRDRPEDFGLQPDGTPGDTPNRAQRSDNDWSLGEAMHTPIFWAFIAGRVMCSAWGTGLIFHQISLFENLGHPARAAAETYGYVALVIAGSTLFTGWLVGRLRPNIIMTMQLTGLMLANGLATAMTPSALLIAYAIAFGFFMGIGSVFDGTVWANLFGRTHQGAIRGFVATTLVAGTSIGPITFGLAFDHLGSYNSVLWIGVALSAVVSLLSLVAPHPQRAA